MEKTSEDKKMIGKVKGWLESKRMGEKKGKEGREGGRREREGKEGGWEGGRDQEKYRMVEIGERGRRRKEGR